MGLEIEEQPEPMEPTDQLTHSVTTAISDTRDGDAEAFKRLVERFGPMVFRAANGQLQGRQTSAVDDASDVGQHVWQAVWTGLRTGHPWMVSTMTNRKGFRAALMRMAKLRAKNVLRDSTALRRGGGAVLAKSQMSLDQTLIDRHGESSPVNVVDGKFLIEDIERELHKIADGNAERAEQLVTVLRHLNQSVPTKTTAETLNLQERSISRLRVVIRHTMLQMIKKESEGLSPEELRWVRS